MIRLRHDMLRIYMKYKGNYSQQVTSQQVGSREMILNNVFEHSLIQVQFFRVAMIREERYKLTSVIIVVCRGNFK